MLRILMVCLGNICRSPLAEGLLKSKLDTSKYFVDSAGTGSWHIGHQPDKRSIAVADKYNLRPLHGNFLQKKTKKYGYHLVIRILNCILGL